MRKRRGGSCCRVPLTLGSTVADHQRVLTPSSTRRAHPAGKASEEEEPSVEERERTFGVMAKRYQQNRFHLYRDAGSQMLVFRLSKKKHFCFFGTVMRFCFFGTVFEKQSIPIPQCEHRSFLNMHKDPHSKPSNLHPKIVQVGSDYAITEEEGRRAFFIPDLQARNSMALEGPKPEINNLDSSVSLDIDQCATLKSKP
jgi:hypothetical protein